MHKNNFQAFYIFENKCVDEIYFVRLLQQWHHWKCIFFRSSFWNFNFLAITEEKEIYLIISISKQCMEICPFTTTYTVISELFDDVHNSILQNFELSLLSREMKKKKRKILSSQFEYFIFSASCSL